MSQPIYAARIVPLSQNKLALVDADDFDRINSHKWCAHYNSHTKSFYAVRRGSTAGGIIYMHREVVLAQPDQQVDHLFHNTLDNRKVVLRICDQSQNNRNQRLRSDNAARVRGVSWCRYTRKWRACIRIDGKQKTIGRFDSLKDAEAAYWRANIELGNVPVEIVAYHAGPLKLEMM